MVAQSHFFFMSSFRSIRSPNRILPKTYAHFRVTFKPTSFEREVAFITPLYYLFLENSKAVETCRPLLAQMLSPIKSLD